MPKKAGPKRIDPETFSPTVYTPTMKSGPGIPILACSLRWIRGRNVLGGPKDAITSEYFMFPVAISLGEDIQVLFGFRTSDHTWTRSRPEEHEISDRCAKVALAQAWHGIKVTVDLATLSGHFRPLGDGWIAYKNGVRMRNLLAALLWDRWNQGGWSLAVRTEKLALVGFPCTTRQLEKFAEEYGLPKIPA